MSFSSRILHRYLAIGSAALLLAVIDCGASAWKLSIGFRSAAALFVELLLYMLPWYLLAALVVSAAVAALERLRKRARDDGLGAISAADAAGDAWLAAVPAAAAFVWGLYSLTLKSTIVFHNHELGSLLVALAAVAALLGLTVSWLALFVALRALRRRVSRRAARLALTLPPLLALPAAAAWAIGRANQDGFRILGAWLFVGPAAAFALGMAATRVLNGVDVERTRRARRGFLAGTGVAVLASLITSFVVPDLALQAVDARLWSGVLVGGLRTVTDFDRDGYSQLFGGGDCAPFKRQINPGARDIPGDGIDQNCVGGDALPAGADSGPRWFDNPPGRGIRNLVVITIEAVRADHISALGYGRPTTPNIDKLAARSVLFKTFYSASSATPLSLSALWTSHTPSHVRAVRGDRHDAIDPTMPWFPEILQKAGFATGAILTDYLAFDPARWDMGFQRGFNNYDITTHVDQRAGNFYGFPSAEMVPKACAWMKAVGGGKFFLWTHLAEPHQKYEAHPQGPTFGTDEDGLYASDLWAVDYEIGHLLSCLEQQGRMNDTIVVITGDHGESLGEHGVHGHYSSVFEPEVRTLGLMYVPGVGRRLAEQPAVHEDLAPTLLNLLGVRDRFDALRGRNLIPAFSGHSIEPITFFVELEGFRANARAVAFVDFPHKLIHKRGTSNFDLYDVVRDPGERTNLATQLPDVFARMKEETIRHLETAAAMP